MTMKRIKGIKVVFEDTVEGEFPVILISGTPGTGKSTIISSLKTKYPRIQVLNVSDFIKEEGLHDGYDPEFDTYIINDRKTQKRLIKVIPKMKRNGPVLIECHSCGLFDEDEMEILVDKVFVLTCTTEILYDRLKSRGYSTKKITENVECEIMRVCADECGEVFQRVQVGEMENNTKSDQEVIITEISKILE